jgi:hypothetical protein
LFRACREQRLLPNSSGHPLPSSPPAKKSTASEQEARKTSTGDWAGDGTDGLELHTEKYHWASPSISLENFSTKWKPAFINGHSESTFNRAEQRFGKKGVVDMTGISGYYTFLAMQLNMARYEFSGAGPRLSRFPN